MDASHSDVDYYDGKIYLTYDFKRTKGKEIILCVLTGRKYPSSTGLFPPPSIISEPDRLQGTENQG